MKTVNRKAPKVNLPRLVDTKDLGRGIFLPTHEQISPEDWSEARVRLLMVYLDATYPKATRPSVPKAAPKAGKPTLSIIDGGLSA